MGSSLLLKEWQRACGWLCFASYWTFGALCLQNKRCLWLLMWKVDDSRELKWRWFERAGFCRENDHPEKSGSIPISNATHEPLCNRVIAYIHVS